MSSSASPKLYAPLCDPLKVHISLSHCSLILGYPLLLVLTQCLLFLFAPLWISSLKKKKVIRLTSWGKRKYSRNCCSCHIQVLLVSKSKLMLPTEMVLFLILKSWSTDKITTGRSSCKVCTRTVLDLYFPIQFFLTQNCRFVLQLK